MAQAPLKEWSRGWTVMLSSISLCAVIYMHPGVLSALMVPLHDAYGWSRAQVSATMMLICGSLLLAGPLYGVAADRYGVRRVTLAGMLLYPLAFAAVGLSGPGLWSWYLTWGLVALIYPAIAGMVQTAIISQWFVKSRGLALAVSMTGAGVANAVGPLVTAKMLEVADWRAAFFVLGGLMYLVALPLVLLFFKEKDAYRPKAGETPAAAVPGMTTREALRSTVFWRITLVVSTGSATVGALGIHFLPILRDAGLTAGQAAGYAALMGPALIVGRITGGFLMDRLPVQLVAGASFLSPALACTMLLFYDGSAAMSAGVACLIGASFGVEGDVKPYLISRYFGMRKYGMIYSVSYGIQSITFGLAPVLAGLMFDISGNYDVMLKILIGALVLAAGLLFTLPKPPVFEGGAEAEPAPVALGASTPVAG